MNDAQANRGFNLPLGRFAAYAAVLGGIVAVFALCWLLRDVVLLVFGAIVLAVIVRALSAPLARRTRLSDRWAVAVVVVGLLAALGGVFWFFGQQIAGQLTGLAEKLPGAVEQVRAWLESEPAGRVVAERLSSLGSDGRWIEAVQTFASVSATTLGHAALMLFAGIYLAASPSLYLDGFVRLFPPRQRRKLHDALVGSGGALRKWLLGQIVSMASVGVLTWLGLWIVGAPLPLGLGLLAGLLEFIPIVGPVLAAIPGVMVAFTEGPQVALYAAIVYLAVQQIEGNAIMPLAQRWAVELPPALGLFSLLAFGLLFGFLGILFGSPLAVAVMSLVQTLYIARGLEKRPPAKSADG